EAMSAETVPEALRMWPLVTPERLTPEQLEDMERRLGTGATAAEGYAHWENRRRIVKHYFMTHPATLQALLGGYGLARDSNPLHFALERGWQMGSGQEMFTEQGVPARRGPGVLHGAGGGSGRWEVDDRHAARARVGCPGAGGASGPWEGGGFARS